jgi:hypothetical protein
MADDGSNASGDDWWDAVSKLTGYEPEARDKLFDPSLLGNNKIPLMKLEIDNYDVEPEDAELAAINDLGQWRMQNSGWRVQNTDFVVPFYSGDTGVGSIVTMRRARITLLGTTGVNEEYGPNGGVNMGATFTEHGSKLMGDNFGGWDSRPLARYSFGGGMALNALLNDPYSTWRFNWNDKQVGDDNAIDLTGFDRVAKAFDRVAQFFHTSRATIQGWEDELGNEETAAWRGQAAGVFWDIVHQLGVMYQGYTDTLPTVNGASKVGDELRQVRLDIYNALSRLHSTWNTWSLGFFSNPLRVLHDVLLEVTDDLWYNNITKVRTHWYYTEGGSYTENKVEYDGFRTSAHDKNGNVYGDMNSMDTWHAIGAEAVKRWQKGVDDNLGKAGHQALVDVHNSWVDVSKIIQKLTTPSISLQSDYQMDKAAAAQDKADADAAAAAAHQKEMEDKAAADAAAAAAHQKEMEDKADKERAEDLAHQKEMEDKAEKEREEQEQHQKEMEDKAEKEREEQEQHQKEQEDKQEALQAQQQAQAQAQYAQQRKDQEEQEKKQEALQKQQQEQAQQQYQEQMAQQQALQKQQEKKQEEQEKKQEQLQAEQEKKQEQLQAKQEQKQEEQEKKQEEQQKHQEELAQQQYQQQQKTQADYQQKQEQQQAEQEKKQEEQEKKQETLQKQQQDQAEKQYEQQQKQFGQLPGGNGTADQLQQQQDQFQHQLESLAHNQIGSQTHVNPDGSVTTDYSDGSSTTFNPHTGQETTTLPNGHVSTEHVANGHSFTNPDGSTTTVNSDGTLTTHYPDGSTTTVNPKTGMATTHEPDGRTITTNLSGGSTLPHVPYEAELHDLPFDGSLGSAVLPAGQQMPTSAASPAGNYLPPGTYMDGTTTGGMPPAGTPMTGGMPMGGGGMPMGGMGGGMGGGEKGGGGERVRHVYEDDDIVTTDGGSLGRRSRRGTEYERETAAGRRTSTASGYDPYAAGSEREQTESGERERETWVPEEEDVWGTDEGGSPAVIG